MPTFEEQYLSKILPIKYKWKLFLNEVYFINYYFFMKIIFYLEVYSEPCHVSKIELFAIVNWWEALDIFAKKAPSWMFDKALNPLMCINCLINDKKRYFKVRQINLRGRWVH